METPDGPPERTAASLGKAADARGLEAARWAGRGDEERGLRLIALDLAAAYFVVLFMPWLASVSAWTLRVGDDSGVLALALVLVKLLRLRGGWTSRGSDLVAFCLVAATGIMGLATWATLGSGGAGSQLWGSLQYGAWLGFVLALALIALAALRLRALMRSVP